MNYNYQIVSIAKPEQIIWDSSIYMPEGFADKTEEEIKKIADGTLNGLDEINPKEYYIKILPVVQKNITYRIAQLISELNFRRYNIFHTSSTDNYYFLHKNGRSLYAAFGNEQKMDLLKLDSTLEAYIAISLPKVFEDIYY